MLPVELVVALSLPRPLTQSSLDLIVRLEPRLHRSLAQLAQLQVKISVEECRFPRWAYLAHPQLKPLLLPLVVGEAVSRLTVQIQSMRVPSMTMKVLAVATPPRHLLVVCPLVHKLFELAQTMAVAQGLPVELPHILLHLLYPQSQRVLDPKEIFPQKHRQARNQSPELHLTFHPLVQVKAASTCLSNLDPVHRAVSPSRNVPISHQL